MGIKLYFGINKNISKELLVIIIIKIKLGVCQRGVQGVLKKLIKLSGLKPIADEQYLSLSNMKKSSNKRCLSPSS